MKPIICICLVLLCFTSCKKEIKTVDHDSYMNRIKVALKDSLSAIDYGLLDFNRPVVSSVNSLHLYYARIPLKGRQLRNDFIIVKTDYAGNVERGKIVHLEGSD